MVRSLVRGDGYVGSAYLLFTTEAMNGSSGVGRGVDPGGLLRNQGGLKPTLSEGLFERNNQGGNQMRFERIISRRGLREMKRAAGIKHVKVPGRVLRKALYRALEKLKRKVVDG